VPASGRLGPSLLGSALVALLVAGGTYAALAPLPSPPHDLTYVVPPGTAARLASGAELNVLPSTIHLTVGVRDVLVLRNEDDAMHQVGPILLGPRQTYRIPFRIPGRFQYACSLHIRGQLDIVVDPAPPVGWARLLWRLARD
jgi:hypothetical protein